MLRSLLASETHARRAALVLAVLLPATILGGLGLALHLTVDHLPTKEVARIQQTVDAARPDVVMLGSSVPISAFDPAQLQVGGSVADLMTHGSDPAFWYAIARHQVYDRGHRPRVLVVSEGVLAFRAVASRDYEALYTYAGDDAPVLAAKVFGVEPGDVWWRRRMAARIRLRDLLVQGLPREVAARFVVEERNPRVEQANLDDEPDLVEEALVRLLRSRGQQNEVQQVAPLGGVVSERPRMEYLPEPHPLLGDLVEVAQAHGSRVVFVLAPSRVVHTGTDQMRRDLGAYFTGIGADVVDMSELEIPDAGWADLTHFHPSMQPYLTSVLQDALWRLQAQAPRGRGRIVPVRAGHGASPPPAQLLQGDGRQAPAPRHGPQGHGHAPAVAGP